MKFLAASLALLGVEVAMAVAAPQDASPTRPRTAIGVQETRRIAQAGPAAADNVNQLKETGQARQTEASLLYHQEAKRQQTSMSSSAAPSSSASDGAASGPSQSDAIVGASTAPTGPVTTELAFFTAGEGVYSVSSLDGGINVVAGKTITVGGPDALVGGEEVSAAPSGLIVNGAEVQFETVTISPSVSISSVAMSGSGSGMAGTMSSAAAGSASESAGAASGSSSPGFAVPRATAGAAGVVAAVGAVVGVLVL